MRNLKLCFTTYAGIMLNLYGKFTQQDLIGELLLCFETDSASVYSKFNDKDCISKYVNAHLEIPSLTRKRAQSTTNHNEIQAKLNKYANKYLNGTDLFVILLKLIIIEDSTISKDTIIDLFNNYRKSDLYSCDTFNSENNVSFIGGVLAYVIAYTKSTKTGMKKSLITKEYIDRVKFAESFVNELHKICCNDLQPNDNLHSWIMALLTQRASVSDVAYHFIGSEQYKGSEISNVEYVSCLYRIFLNERAEASSKDYWVKMLSLGTTRYEVLKQFMESSEFSKKCDDYSIEYGTLPHKPGKIEISFLSMTDEVYSMVESYYSTHPSFASKYKIINKYMNDNPYSNNLKHSLEHGEPDIYLMETENLYPYVNGILSQYAAPYDQLLPDCASRVQKSAIAPYIVNFGTRSADRKIVALSYQSTAGVFIYRRSIARDIFGSDSPDTIEKAIGANTNSWDAYLAAAEKLNAKGYAIASSLSDLWIVTGKASKSPWILDGELNIDPIYEDFLDVSRKMIQNKYCKDSILWSENWLYDIRENVSRKVMGFFGPVWFINNLIQDNNQKSLGDWAVCEAPFHFYWGGTWIMANKSVLGTEKATGVAKLINYITLDCTKKGFQYKWSTSQIRESGTQDTVSSMTVMNMLDNYSWGILGGQNPSQIFKKVTSEIDSLFIKPYDDILNNRFFELIYQYAHDSLSKNDVFAELTSFAKQVVNDDLLTERTHGSR